MRRILHIIAQRPEKTGSGTYLQALVKEGDKKGYSQAVVAGVPKDSCSINFNTYNKKVNFYPVVFETEKLPFSVVGMTDVMPYKNTKYSEMDEDMYIKWKEAFSKVLCKAVEEFKPDIIISNHLWLLSVLCKELFPNIPVTAICHGTDLRQLQTAKQFSEYVIKGFKNIENIAALHEEQKQSIIKSYGIEAEKIKVVGVGYNKDVFCLDDTPRRNEVIKLVYAGKLNFAKGVPSLIRAYNRLSKDLGPVELILAGAGVGQEEEEIKAMVKHSDLKVTFKGAISQQQLSQLFKESHIFVFPSFFEGLPLVLIEALASGMRVVTTNLPGVKAFMGEYIRKTGIVEFVDMPKLETIDRPFEEELPSYEERFKMAIEKQIDKVKGRDHRNDEQFLNDISNMQWKNVFYKIEKSFKSL